MGRAWVWALIEDALLEVVGRSGYFGVELDLVGEVQELEGDGRWGGRGRR